MNDVLGARSRERVCKAVLARKYILREVPGLVCLYPGIWIHKIARLNFWLVPV